MHPRGRGQHTHLRSGREPFPASGEEGGQGKTYPKTYPTGFPSRGRPPVMGRYHRDAAIRASRQKPHIVQKPQAYRSRRSYRSHRPYRSRRLYRSRRNRRRARNLLQDETGIPWYNYGGNRYRSRKHAPARPVGEE